MLFQRYGRSLLLLPLMLWGTGLPAYGSVDRPSLEEAVEGIADFIADRIQEESHNRIRVAQFSDPFDAGKSYGPEIQRAFQLALQRRDLEIAHQAEIVLEGEFQVSNARQELAGGETREIAAMRISYSLRSRSRVIASSEVNADYLYVLDPDDIVTGEDVYVAPDEVNGSLPERLDEELYDRVHESDPVRTADIVGSEVYPEAGAGYSIEVLVADLKPDGSAPEKSEYTAVNLNSVSGRAFADIAVGQVYAVRINNYHDHEMAAYVEVDGLSTFEFSEFRDELTGFWIIPANSTATIYGWHRNYSTEDTFKVVEDVEQQSAAALDYLDLNYGDVGTISVKYHRSWLPDDPPPADEPSELLVRTDKGPPITNPSTPVRRKIGRLRGNVNIRYDRSRISTD